VTNINPYGPAQYQQYPQYGGYQQPAYGGYQPAGTGYAGDGYQGSPYATGYSQGVNAVGGTAMGMSSLSTGVSSMASSIGGIFGKIFDMIAGILNTVVNLVVNVIEGILGIFGIGKKDDKNGQTQQSGGPAMPLPGNQGMGVASPLGTPLPPPPPGTDLIAAYDIVAGDLKNVDPNQGIQIINIHAQKTKDYRDKAEQFAKEAEKESREAAYAAEEVQKRGANQAAKLAELQSHKSKAMDLLKTAQEYTKAVYDEALYAQAANDIINNNTRGALGNRGTQAVTEAWKNWIGGTVERKFVFFKENMKPAPEVFMTSMNAVNANIGRATQVLNAMTAGQPG
jgi:hypothetical protein